MPEKFDRCVAKVKANGNDNPYAVCNVSVGNGKSKTREKVNQNRQDPYPTLDIKKGKVEPQINKTPKGIGGEKIGNMTSHRKKQEAILYKQILDVKLRHVAPPQAKRY